MNEDATYPEWLIASLKVLPKKGDLKNPNNWRGIILLDVNSKIISIFINTKLQKLLKTQGIAHQVGATPKLGCQDAVFVLKTFLQERREKLLDTWVVFIDLVKAYDSIQHKVIDETLHIFGVPEIIRTWIKKLYNDSVVELKVGKFKHHIPCGCGVKQVDSVAPTLFIMVFQLAVMELSAEFKKNNVKILEAQVSESTTEALIRKHGVSDMMKMDPIALLILLYLDDGAIPFASRRDATIGTKLCIDVMSKFGLIIHTRTAKKESKTKAVFFSSTLTIKRWRKTARFFL